MPNPMTTLLTITLSFFTTNDLTDAATVQNEQRDAQTQPAERELGETMIREADTPEGWPEITRVGEIEVKTYPEYRAAVAREGDGSSESRMRRGGQNSMFWSLFQHIQRNDIPMTAPVDMGYTENEDGRLRVNSMAFLYPAPDDGTSGEDGDVMVETLPARQWATIGVRGDYTTRNFEQARAKLIEWLEGQDEWVIDGDPQKDARYLGYNGPSVARSARYGEVQIPVLPSGATSGEADHMEAGSEQAESQTDTGTSG